MIFNIRLLFIAGGLLALSGCGTGEYNARMQASLSEKQRGAAFDINLHKAPIDFDDKTRPRPGVSIRLPLLFDATSNSAAGQPPGITLPGLWYGMEKVRPDSAGKNLAVYFGVGWVPKGEKKEPAMQAELLGLVKGSFPAAAWQDVSLASPTGGPVSFKLLSGTADQNFNTGVAETPTEKAPGQFRLYLVSATNDYVLVAWRGPTSGPDFWTIVDAAMGSVKVEKLEAPAAPKAGEAAAKPAA